jgi:hypothetical protein
MAGIRACGLLLALTTLAGTVAPGETVCLRYSMRLEELEVLRQRLELEAAGWRLVALDARRGLDPLYQAAGLETPWLLLGPVEPGGLLRELANPLGFTPGSAVFGERSGVRLETSLAGTSRRGLRFAPLADWLTLYALCSRSPPIAFGGLLRLPLGRAFLAELLCQEALPGPASGSEDWFAAQPAYPGGPLMHLAARIGLRSPADQEETAGPILSWGAAMCAGPRVRPGIYYRLIAGLESPWAAVEALLGYCTEGYRLPAGTMSDQASQVACRIRIGSSSGMRLEADWDRRIGLPDREPASTASAFLPVSERWSVRLQAKAERRGEQGVRFEAAGELSTHWSADGALRREAGAELELHVESRRREGQAGLSGTWKEEGGRNRIRGYVGYRWDDLEVQGGWALDPASFREVSLFGELQCAGSRKGLFLRVDGGPVQPLQLTLGWSASQELAKAPTARISRSSRQP